MFKIKVEGRSKHTFDLQWRFFRLWDHFEKYGWARQVTDGNIIWRKRFACWITKATNTHTYIHWHSKYVNLITFHSNIIFAKASHYYVIRISSLLYWRNMKTWLHVSAQIEVDIKPIKILRGRGVALTTHPHLAPRLNSPSESSWPVLGQILLYGRNSHKSVIISRKALLSQILDRTEFAKINMNKTVQNIFYYLIFLVYKNMTWVIIYRWFITVDTRCVEHYAWGFSSTHQDGLRSYMQSHILWKYLFCDR